MKEQERKLSLAEVHTKMGTMVEIQLNQTFLDVLGVKPGDFSYLTSQKKEKLQFQARKTQQSGLAYPCQKQISLAFLIQIK